MDNLDFNLEETEKKVTFIFQTMLPILLPTKNTVGRQIKIFRKSQAKKT